MSTVLLNARRLRDLRYTEENNMQKRLNDILLMVKNCSMSVAEAEEELETRGLKAVDPVVEANRAALLHRSTVGIKKYNKMLNRPDLGSVDWLQHLREELLDAVNYVEALRQHSQRLGVNASHTEALHRAIGRLQKEIEERSKKRLWGVSEQIMEDDVVALREVFVLLLGKSAEA